MFANDDDEDYARDQICAALAARHLRVMSYITGPAKAE